MIANGSWYNVLLLIYVLLLAAIVGYGNPQHENDFMPLAGLVWITLLPVMCGHLASCWTQGPSATATCWTRWGALCGPHPEDVCKDIVFSKGTQQMQHLHG
jgi:hypothetical protein